jgi:hypothetical protein
MFARVSLEGADFMASPARLYQDRRSDWRVEWSGDDGEVEVAIFSGPNARQRAIEYAEWRYGQFASPATPLHSD